MLETHLARHIATQRRNIPVMPEERLTKSQRQEAAREKARVQREEQIKKQRRTRLAIQLGVVVGVLGIAALITALVINLARSSSNGAIADGPANMISDGIVIGKGLVAERTAALNSSASPTDAAAHTENRLIVYLDYQCPNCANFEATNGSQIEGWVKSGKITLEIRPISFLDRSSLNEYSSRAANAAACVANYAPDSFFTFNTAMFNNQPEEGTSGPTNSDIVALIESVTGTTNTELASCVTSGTYASWVTQATDRGIGQPNEYGLTVTGTPGVFFNGTAVSGNITTDASVLAAAVSSAIG